MSIAVNPLEGQVAISWQRAPGGAVVGRLSARAMRWIEEATGRALDEIYRDAVSRVAMTGDPMLPVGVTATVIWAGIEHERRRQHGPLPEYSIDDAEEIIDEVGLDDAYGYALALIQLSTPFKARAAQVDAAAAAAGEESPLNPLRAAAAAAAPGTGTSSSEPPTEPASPTPGP